MGRPNYIKITKPSYHRIHQRRRVTSPPLTTQRTWRNGSHGASRKPQECNRQRVRYQNASATGYDFLKIDENALALTLALGYLIVVLGEAFFLLHTDARQPLLRSVSL